MIHHTPREESVAFSVNGAEPQPGRVREACKHSMAELAGQSRPLPWLNERVTQRVTSKKIFLNKAVAGPLFVGETGRLPSLFQEPLRRKGTNQLHAAAPLPHLCLPILPQRGCLSDLLSQAGLSSPQGVPTSPYKWLIPPAPPDPAASETQVRGHRCCECTARHDACMAQRPPSSRH